MDAQALLLEIRGFLFKNALNALSIVRWTLIEERLRDKDASDYLDALLAYRDAEVAVDRANKEYSAFLVRYPDKHWEEEERLYNVVRGHKMEAIKTHQILMDLILESESYKQMVQAEQELPEYVK
jgi:hypothetical protein